MLLYISSRNPEYLLLLYRYYPSIAHLLPGPIVEYSKKNTLENKEVLETFYKKEEAFFKKFCSNIPGTLLDYNFPNFILEKLEEDRNFKDELFSNLQNDDSQEAVKIRQMFEKEAISNEETLA